MNKKILYSGIFDYNTMTKQVLKNRGVTNVEEYLSLDESSLCDCYKLENIQDGVEMFMKHINNNSNIYILIDEDVDGFTSGSYVYLTTKMYNKNQNIEFIIHKKTKSHSVDDLVEVPKDCDLLIIPDAGTNDVLGCKRIKQEVGCDILVLDHHNKDVENEYALIINNQIGEYSNKDLSGVGVCYKFFQCVDDNEFTDNASKYVDLVALGIIADNIDIRSHETKYIIDLGLKNVKNKFFKEMIERHLRKNNKHLTIKNVQFSIVPQINALIRLGSFEEKETLFKAFIQSKEEFEYTYREKTTIENASERAARLCYNAKQRQDKYVKKCIPDILEKINKNNVIATYICEDEKIKEYGLTGLLAIKIASILNKPCVILTEKNEDEYGGSGRNFSNSPIESFQNFIESTNTFKFAQGHDNAFGVGVKKDNVDKFNEISNEMLKDIDFSKVYNIDFVVDEDDITIKMVMFVDSFNRFLGTNISDVIFNTQITLTKENCDLMGKEKNSFSYLNENGIKFVKFSLNKEDKLLEWYNDFEDNQLTIDVVGNLSLNTFNNVTTPQFIIDEYEILSYNKVEKILDKQEDSDFDEDEWEW